MQKKNSYLSCLKALSPDQLTAALDKLTKKEIQELSCDWELVGRPKQQLPKGDWRTAVWCCGRGWGKSITGASLVRQEVESGRSRRIALIGPTASHLRDVMIESDVGILGISPDWNRPLYESSKRRITWKNGAVAHCYSGERVDLLRGPQHDFAWMDEACSLSDRGAYDTCLLGLRVGNHPRIIITTTPKPKLWFKAILDDPFTVVTQGTTYENKMNLPPAFFDSIVKQYEGSSLAEQEILGKYLEDLPDSLFRRKWLNDNRVSEYPDLQKILVSVDPAVSSKKHSHETGIIVGGKKGDDFYVLADQSMKGTTKQWGTRVCETYREWNADKIVCEDNQGKELLEDVLRSLDSGITYSPISAHKSKKSRAGPIGVLFEQGRIHLVGSFPILEDQLVLFTGKSGEANDRVDALVHCIAQLRGHVLTVPSGEIVSGVTGRSKFKGRFDTSRQPGNEGAIYEAWERREASRRK